METLTTLVQDHGKRVSRTDMLIVNLASRTDTLIVTLARLSLRVPLLALRKITSAHFPVPSENNSLKQGEENKAIPWHRMSQNSVTEF